VRVFDDGGRLRLRDAPPEFVVEALLLLQLLLNPLQPGPGLRYALGEVGDVALLAATRVMLEFFDVVKQRLDEADGRLAPLLIKLIKLVSSKRRASTRRRKKPWQRSPRRLREGRDRAITPG
jgi:hypothetical protein